MTPGDVAIDGFSWNGDLGFLDILALNKLSAGDILYVTDRDVIIDPDGFLFDEGGGVISVRYNLY